MNVIGYNHSKKTVVGVTMKNSLEELLTESDAISLHVTHKEENHNLITKEQINMMKDGVIIVNVADRECINEQDMANALKSGKVFGYAYEGEDLESTPLAKFENAIGLKAFGWYTTEALEKLFQIWVDNIESMAKNEPQNVVN